MWPWKIPALAVAPPWLLLVADACVLEISFGLLVKCTFWFSTYTKNNRWSLNNLSMKLYFLNTYDRGMSFSLVFLLLLLYYIFSELFVFPDFVFLYFLYVSEIWIKLTIDQLTKILKEKKNGGGGGENSNKYPFFYYLGLFFNAGLVSSNHSKSNIALAFAPLSNYEVLCI